MSKKIYLNRFENRMGKFVSKFINSKFVFVVYLHYLDCNKGRGASNCNLNVTIPSD